MADQRSLQHRADKKRLSTMTRHVLVCVGDDCDEGSRLAKRLKKRVAAVGARAQVTTTKVTCLGICKGGPVMVVYPEGVWYAGVCAGVADRIVDEHLVAGQPVAEHAFLRNPLCALTHDAAAVTA